MTCGKAITESVMGPRNTDGLGMRTTLAAYVIFLIVGFAIYYEGFDTPFYYDSAAKLEGRSHFLDRGLLSALNVFPQRPLPIVTFYVDYLAFGTQSGYYRAVNVGILAAVSVVVVVLLYQILGIQGIWTRGSPGEKKILCLVLGMLYLVHPLQVFVTLYVWQRMALMACLFYFATLAVYVSVRRGGFKHKKSGYGLCLLFFICAMLSKENSVTLPLILIVFELAFFWEGRRNLLGRGAIYVLITIVLLWAITYLQHPHGDIQASAGILSTISVYYAESNTTLKNIFLTQARELFHYISLILAPFPSRVQLISPQVISRSLFDPSITLVAVIGAISLTAAGVYLIRTSPLSGVGILFLVVNLIPEPVLAPQYSFFAYRAILPMFGVLLVTADCTRVLLESVKQPGSRRLIGVGICAFALGLVGLMGLATNKKAIIWANSVRFWTETVESFPPLTDRVETRAAAQALANLGWALCTEQRYSEALPYLERARTLLPGEASTPALLAFANAGMGNSKKAEQLFKRSIAMRSDSAFAHKELGLLLVRSHREDEARFHLQRALELAPHYSSVRRVLEEISSR